MHLNNDTCAQQKRTNLRGDILQRLDGLGLALVVQVARDGERLVLAVVAAGVRVEVVAGVGLGVHGVVQQVGRLPVGQVLGRAGRDLPGGADVQVGRGLK